MLAPLRDAATAVLDALTTTVPAPLPAVFERRLRTLIGRLSLASAPALIDALFGTLPLSTPPNTTSENTANNATTAAIGLTHADKLLILSLVSAPLRLEKAISILSRAREGLSTRDRIDQTVARRQREFALLQQLLAIRTELDQLAKESGRGGGGGSAGAGGQSRGLPSLPGNGSKAITSRKKGAVPSRKGRAGGGGFAADDGAADDDDEEEDEMAELERKVEAKHFSDEARRVAHREMKRLKKTPPQGAEHGVIRAFFLFFAFPFSATLGVSPHPSRLLTSLRNNHRNLHRDAAGHSVDRRRLDSAAVVSRLCRAGEEETRPGPLRTRCVDQRAFSALFCGRAFFVMRK